MVPLAVAIMVGTACHGAALAVAAGGAWDGGPFWWLTRAYFVSYTASQVLPTSIGGDASRVDETSRRLRAGRRPDRIVLLERGLGGAATLLLGAIGFGSRSASYDVGAYLWLELAFVVGTILARHPVLLALGRGRCSPDARRCCDALRVDRPLRAFYEGVHAFRSHGRLLGGVFALTLALQAVRVLAIWATAKAVGDRPVAARLLRDGPAASSSSCSSRSRSTGFAVREAFFVSFLGQLGVSADAAFAAGFLFFLVTVALALPGA